MEAGFLLDQPGDADPESGCNPCGVFRPTDCALFAGTRTFPRSPAICIGSEPAPHPIEFSSAVWVGRIGDQHSQRPSGLLRSANYGGNVSDRADLRGFGTGALDGNLWTCLG